MNWPDDYLITGIEPFHQEEAGIIYCADCLYILPRLPKVDLVLTDPPYGIGMDNEKVRTKPSRPNTYKRRGLIKYKGPKWDIKPLDKAYFDEMFRISSNQIIWGANYYCSYFPNRYGWIYWDKQMGNNSFSSGEFAFQSRFIKSSSFAFSSMRVPGTRVHPTQKPLELMEWCLGFFPEADIILDPFLGSGTTAVAAKELGRKFIGIEISEEYCSIAVKRLRQGVLNFE